MGCQTNKTEHTHTSKQTRTYIQYGGWCAQQRGVSPVSGSCSSELQFTHKGFCVVPESCYFFFMYSGTNMKWQVEVLNVFVDRPVL